MTNKLKRSYDFLLINKPPNWTSHDVVAYIRNKIKKSHSLYSHLFVDSHRVIKVGHAGTLDPFATGLLIVGVGREATKRLDEFKKLPKTYIATLHLGAVSNTYDRTGVIKTLKHESIKTIQQKNNEAMKQSNNGTMPTLDDIEQSIKQFIGKISQIPPMHSAKKICGKKLYELARKGIVVERVPAEIEIMDIKILEYSWPRLKIEVICSAGTYMRTLAHDIGEKLGVGAYCEELVRTKIGEYKLENAVDPRGFATID